MKKKQNSGKKNWVPEGMIQWCHQNPKEGYSEPETQQITRPFG